MIFCFKIDHVGIEVKVAPVVYSNWPEPRSKVVEAANSEVGGDGSLLVLVKLSYSKTNITLFRCTMYK